MLEEIQIIAYTELVEELLQDADNNLFNDIQFLNWDLKLMKSGPSSFTEKLKAKLKSIRSDVLPLAFEGNISSVPLSVEAKLTEVYGIVIADRLLDAVSKVKKWSELGRLSFLQDVKYLRHSIESDLLSINSPRIGFKLQETFDLLESYLSLYIASENSREDLLDFIKQKGEDKLCYSYV